MFQTPPPSSSLLPIALTCQAAFAVQAAVAPQGRDKRAFQDLVLLHLGKLAGLGLGDAARGVKRLHALLGGSTVANGDDVAFALSVYPAFLNARV